MGNTKGLARVDGQIMAEAPAPEAIDHRVQRGDKLSKIARDHYHDASKYPVISETHRPMLKDPTGFLPGRSCASHRYRRACTSG
jgi:nucleoid-associated protein YgaU